MAAIQPIDADAAQTGDASAGNPRRFSKSTSQIGMLATDGSSSYFEGNKIGGQDLYAQLVATIKGSDMVVALVGLFGMRARGGPGARTMLRGGRARCAGRARGCACLSWVWPRELSIRAQTEAAASTPSATHV